MVGWVDLPVSTDRVTAPRVRLLVLPALYIKMVLERTGRNGDHRMGDFLAEISLSSLYF